MPYLKMLHLHLVSRRLTSEKEQETSLSSQRLHKQSKFKALFSFLQGPGLGAIILSFGLLFFESFKLLLHERALEMIDSQRGM